MNISILLVNISISLNPINWKLYFYNSRIQLCQVRTQRCCVFSFRHKFKKSLCKNIFLVILHSNPSPLVRAPPQLTFTPSPNTFSLCTFISSIPSNVAPFARKKIYNAFNNRSTSLIILTEEGVPIFNSRIRLSTLANLLWRREPESYNPLPLVAYLPILKEKSQDAMKMQGLQDVSIGDIIKRHCFRAITYRSSRIRCPILKSVHRNQPTMELFFLSSV